MVFNFRSHRLCAAARTLLFVGLLYPANAARHQASVKHPMDDLRVFDYFMLVRRWPGSVCAKQEDCQVMSGFGFQFVLHGLWPNYNDGTWPQFCAPDLHFNVSELSNVMDAMRTDWPSTFSDWSDEDLWEHEWSKHGTCALDIFPTQHSYFEHILELHGQYDLVAGLGKAGILPREDIFYKTANVVDAITSMYGVRPLVHCDDKKQLTEIWMCLDKDLQPFDCDPAPEDSGCEEVVIPPFKAAVDQRRQRTEATHVALHQHHQYDQQQQTTQSESHFMERASIHMELDDSVAGSVTSGIASGKPLDDDYGNLYDDSRYRYEEALDVRIPENSIFWHLASDASTQAAARADVEPVAGAGAGAGATTIRAIDSGADAEVESSYDAWARGALGAHVSRGEDGRSNDDLDLGFDLQDVSPTNIARHDKPHIQKQSTQPIELLELDGQGGIPAAVAATADAHADNHHLSSAVKAVMDLLTVADHTTMRLRHQIRAKRVGSASGALAKDEDVPTATATAVSELPHPNGGATAATSGRTRSFVWTSKLRNEAVVAWPATEGCEDTTCRGALVDDAVSSETAALAMRTNKFTAVPAMWGVSGMVVVSPGAGGKSSGGAMTMKAVAMAWPPTWVVLLVSVQLVCIVVIMLSLAMLACMSVLGVRWGLVRGPDEAVQLEVDCSGDDHTAVALEEEGCRQQQQTEGEQWWTVVPSAVHLYKESKAGKKGSLPDPVLLYSEHSNNKGATAGPPGIHHASRDMAAAEDSSREDLPWPLQHVANPLRNSYGAGPVLLLPSAARVSSSRRQQLKHHHYAPIA